MDKKVTLEETPTTETSQLPVEAAQASIETTALKTHEATRNEFDEKKVTRNFPNFCYESLLFGLKKLDQKDASLKATSNDIETMQKKWETVLQCQQKLAKLPSDKSTHPITDEMRKDLDALKSFGIDVIPADAKEISADNLIRIKSELDSSKSKIQTDIQIKTVGINLIMQHCNTFIEALKHIVRMNSQSISAIINNMGKR